MMSTVAMLPVESTLGTQSFCAFSGERSAEGRTVGAALDALSERFPELAEEPMIVVQRFRPDRFFTASQQARLQQLMQAWREARDAGRTFSPADQVELDALVDAELTASGERAEDIARGLGK